MEGPWALGPGALGAPWMALDGPGGPWGALGGPWGALGGPGGPIFPYFCPIFGHFRAPWGGPGGALGAPYLPLFALKGCCAVGKHLRCNLHWSSIGVFSNIEALSNIGPSYSIGALSNIGTVSSNVLGVCPVVGCPPDS